MELVTHEPLTEEEFALLKEYRAVGWKKQDVSIEIKKSIGRVKEAWEYPSYALYQKRDRGNLWLDPDEMVES